LFVAGCGRESKIANASLSFMTKDPNPTARRNDEAALLLKLGVFYEGMTPNELKRILGEPTHVWRAKEEGAKDMHGYDLQMVYRLEPTANLRAFFRDGALQKLSRHLSYVADSATDSEIDLQLQPPRP
jgi:hypothetical protein